MFGKKKKVSSELDVPPAPPPVHESSAVVKAPARAVPGPKPEFPSLPEMPPPPKKKLPTFEEELEREQKMPPVKGALKGELPPPPMGEELPAPPGAGRPKEADLGLPSAPPPGKMPAPSKMEMPPAPPRKEMRMPAKAMPSPEPRGVPPKPEMGEAPPRMPTFDDMEEEVREEESTSMHATGHGPIFVRADNYKGVLDEVTVARNIAKESSEILGMIDDVNTNLDKEFSRWRTSLEDIERKMLFTDKSLFGRR